ncbi:conserved hypothetical protein [uncultured Desulfobacterium sp.]|uniref:Uncharacterized protein n=1 Tax=uncultured Desulfobacterium sp. TaxID=201089 RepID=A0A445MY18_9BACT|nr:conserved hypothetical protein [uncultured Desulfobacterium sp.]
MMNPNIIIITGLSGSGKSTALNALEDLGYFCVDNLPVQILPKFLELHSKSASGIRKLGFCMDMREKSFAGSCEAVLAELKRKGFHPEIIFLEASENALIKRYSQTRRQHPLFDGSSLLESIRAEKTLLKDLKAIADRVIDTTDISVHKLKDTIFLYADKDHETKRMRIQILSFGFKHGLPLEADLLVDVRFLPNPYFERDLKELDGKDLKVCQFVMISAETLEFLDRYVSLLAYMIPLFEREGKSYLTIAVGCTGGRHRSVVIAEEIFSRLRNLGINIDLTHRDIDIF